jgi:hypothetical protein
VSEVAGAWAEAAAGRERRDWEKWRRFMGIWGRNIRFMIIYENHGSIAAGVARVATRHEG